jgi:hypothetical protein
MGVSSSDPNFGAEEMDADAQPIRISHLAVGTLVLTTAWCATLLAVRVLFFS